MKNSAWVIYPNKTIHFWPELDTQYGKIDKQKLESDGYRFFETKEEANKKSRA